MLALVLALSLSFDFGRRAPQPAPAVTCGIKTVSYKFTGTPGTEFRYAGTAYRVPASGSIELIASKNNEYQIGGKSLPLDVWPINDFGIRTVTLPQTQQ